MRIPRSGKTYPPHARPTLAWSLGIAAVFLILWLGPVLLLLLALGSDHVFTDIAVFFSKMAVVTFGGAYAVLAYVAQQAVETYGWLASGEMLDGLGLAETTPGPLIMVTHVGEAQRCSTLRRTWSRRLAGSRRVRLEPSGAGARSFLDAAA
jgi:hypothetical protein